MDHKQAREKEQEDQAGEQERKRQQGIKWQPWDSRQGGVVSNWPCPVNHTRSPQVKTGAEMLDITGLPLGHTGKNPGWLYRTLAVTSGKQLDFSILAKTQGHLKVTTTSQLLNASK